MTQEEKSLLLQDLCARIPYETRVRYSYAFAGAACINEYSTEGTLSYDKLQDFSLPGVGYERRKVVYILPYLRPMSSMTEEEKKEFESFGWRVDELDDNYPWVHIGQIENVLLGLNWLNAHYLDYRRLIEKGLAIKAKEGMYNIKEK